MDARQVYKEAYRIYRKRRHHMDAEPQGLHPLYVKNFWATVNASTTFMQTRNLNDRFEMGRSLLERLYGGVTRKSGFSKELSDQEVRDQMRRAGHYWNGRAWVDARLRRQLRQHGFPLSASEIWGN